MGRDFAKGLFGFDLSKAEFSAQLQIPVLGDLFGCREAFLLVTQGLGPAKVHEAILAD